jgi:hypothetical protein
MPEDLDTPDDEPDDNAVIRDLRKKAEKADAAEAEAQAARRELALHKAGLGDLTDKQMKALTATHEGDWDVESLKASATELGFVKTPADDKPEPRIPPEEMAAHQRVADAAGGGPAPAFDLDAALEAAADDPEQIKTLLAGAGLLAGE